MTKRGAFGTDSSENVFPSVKFAHENEPNDHHLRNKAVFLHTSSQCSEDEQVMSWHIYGNRKKGILYELKRERNCKNIRNIGQLLDQ